MKMIIINKTKWSTKDLRKVFQLALRADNEIEGRFNKNLTITVKYRVLNKIILNQAKLGYIKLKENYYYKGWAYYNTGLMRISLPRKNIDSKIVAQIFIHELGHCRGFKHCQMGHWSKIDTSFLPYSIKIKREDFLSERAEVNRGSNPYSFGFGGGKSAEGSSFYRGAAKKV